MNSCPALLSLPFELSVFGLELLDSMFFHWPTA